jgi:hypothetical protein
MAHWTTLTLCLTFWGMGQPGPSLGNGPGMRPASRDITLQGSASGGILVFGRVPERYPCRRVSVETTPGEAAESVAAKLAAALRSTDVFSPGGWPHTVNVGGSFGPIPEDPPCGHFVFGGTEAGLGIPPAPSSVTASYDSATRQITVRWINPTSGYDSIAVVRNSLGDGPFPGNLTHLTIRDVRRAGVEDFLSQGICVVGYRDGIPSSAAGIYLNHHTQEEAMDLPFSRGVAPNWTLWTTEATAPRLTENKRPDKMKGKLFYQRIKSGKPGAQVGVWRKFLALVPGHTYKVSAWVCTDAMDDSQGDWSFSLHAVPDAPDGREFTVDQLAGRAALPGGASGLQAGAFAAYHRGVTTARKEFARASTDAAENTPGRQITNITLPPNVTSITVWARYMSSDPNASGVAFDHLRLEDLSEQK